MITADIAKMYRQILMHPEDRRFQRIFWYHEGEIRVFQLNTVTFGVSAAPFLAIRTIHQLANDESSSFPLGSEVLKRDLYVDDLLTGANTYGELMRIRDQVIQVLKRGGFEIRQWSSNHPRALEKLNEKSGDIEFLTDENPVRKTLGISWNSRRDELIYTVKPIPKSEKTSKRYILSEISKIFDPLGLLAPILLASKVIMQECWKANISWDESVPLDLYTSWHSFARQLELIDHLTIERNVLIDDPIDIQIHGFCDASLIGYGACLYVRSRDQSGKVRVRLYCAKARVAPIGQPSDESPAIETTPSENVSSRQASGAILTADDTTGGISTKKTPVAKKRKTKTQMTIPRLELCGALILARLFRELRAVLTFVPDRVIFWSDSTIVLQWLKKSPNSLKVFEATRVREIQEITAAVQWRHVRTEQNPADPLSRSQFPREFLNNDTWFHGPSWLSGPESDWPESVVKFGHELPGLKKTCCFVSRVESDDFFRNFSSYTKLIRFVAYSLRFLRSSKHKKCALSISEINEAERRVIGLIQRSSFQEEIERISCGQSAKSPKLGSLAPLIKDDGLLRVGGRLKHANIPVDQRQPILLPSRHYVTDLLIRDTHERFYHAGIQSTLYSLRYRFWILDGKGQVRRIVRRCVRCTRFRRSAVKYKMGDLPMSRVNEYIPFSHTGFDCFGPMYVKEKKFRNRGRVKVWGCVFICMSTKAVHIELLSDCTSDAFLASFRRFVGRRAIPQHVYSDNGPNFVGANSQLRELYALFESAEFRSKISDYALERKITWHFNPPASPHFGGVWEAAVKSFKHHFKRAVGDRLFTFEELYTFAVEIEAILNSRPLCPISTDPNDPVALTPAHILVGRPLTMLPENDFLPVPENRLSSWQLITKARQGFWRRWQLEYLSELQKRQKWLDSEAGLKLDDIVLLIDKDQPCMQWQLGRVVALHPGDDGVVRVVSVKTSKRTYKRNSRTLVLLPVSSSSDN